MYAKQAYLDRPVNSSIWKKAPSECFALTVEQRATKLIKCGSITDLDKLKDNLTMNCILLSVVDKTFENYEEFLEERRKLMV